VTARSFGRRAAEQVLIPVAAVVLSLATGALLLLAVGADPVSAYESMFKAAFGSVFSASVTLGKAIPRLMAALGIALALRAGLWNIGAEGQIYVGGAASTAVVLAAPDLPFPMVLVLALAAGALAGALWGAIPGIMRASRGISEVITSLMLVYVAIQLTNYLLEGPWVVPHSTFPATEPFPSEARLPILWQGTLFNAGVIIALLSLVLAWALSDRSTFGLKLRAFGGGEQAARFAGVRVKRLIVAAMAVSGAFAGLAGSVEILGVRGRLLEGFSPGYGFEAIAIALIGRLQPAGILLAAVFFGALDAGAAGLLTSGRGVPASIVQMTEAMAVIYVLIALGAREKLNRRRRARAVLEAARHDGAVHPDEAGEETAVGMQ
jgi:simple sugar transport system permease protein